MSGDVNAGFDSVDADLAAAFEAHEEVKPEVKPDAEVKAEAKDDGEQEEKTEVDTPEAKAEEKPEEKQTLRAPEGLKPEFKVRFAELDPEWQAEILRREQDAARGISNLSEQAKLAKDIDRVLMPYEPMIQTMGASKAEIVGNFMQTAYVLNHGTPEQKAAVVGGIMQQYGVTLPEPGEQQQVSPEVAALRQELAVIKQQLGAGQQQEGQITRQQAMSDVDAFAADTNNEFFPDVKAEMGKLIQSGIASDLKDAYDKACRLNPEVLKAIQAKERQATQLAAARAAKDAKAAAKQVSGSGPSDEIKKVHDDPREDVRAALEKALG